MTTAIPLSEFQWWYGRDEPPLEPRPLRAGPVTAQLVGRDLRNVRCGGLEVAQRIYVAVRDRNWGTVPGEITSLTIAEDEATFDVQLTVSHRYRDIDFVWQGRIQGQPDGTISYAMEATAGTDMTYKLIGLNVHHGMREYAGRPCQARTIEGPIADVFPTEVAPQLIADETEIPLFPPVESIDVQLTDDISVRFDFEGDTFEFEDQRNWTDASFKSQSYPPRRGGVLSIRQGERVRQKVTITPSGAPPPDVRDDGPIRIEIDKGSRVRVPPLGFGIASSGERLQGQTAARLSALRPDHLRVDLWLADPEYPAEMARAIADTSALQCGLELALHLTDDAEAELADLASRLRDQGRVDRVLVFHEEEPATDPRWLDLVREELREVAPHALFAGGADANFCEFNRFRPGGGSQVGIVYSVNPQIHAFDEQSLVENIASEADTVRTAQTYSGGRPIVVSPVTLKQRFNSVATAAEPNVSGELPPQVDPRQMSLFAAAWTVGSLKTLIESGVAAATYYETTGWRGVMQGDSLPPLPELFPARAGMVFPVYHVFADLAEAKDGDVVPSRASNPLAVETLALAGDGGLRLLVANLTPEPQTVALAVLSRKEIFARRLNADTAEGAAFNPDNFRAQGETLAAAEPLQLTLAPFEVVRLDAREVPAK